MCVYNSGLDLFSDIQVESQYWKVQVQRQLHALAQRLTRHDSACGRKFVSPLLCFKLKFSSRRCTSLVPRLSCAPAQEPGNEARGVSDSSFKKKKDK